MPYDNNSNKEAHAMPIGVSNIWQYIFDPEIKINVNEPGNW